MAKCVLRARSLWKSFEQNRNWLQAVEGVSFAVEEGEFICIVGPSGCGKTTLLKLLGGLWKSSRGEVLLDRTTLSGPHWDIGIVFQKPNLLPWRTVLDNVMLPMQLSKIPANEAQEKANEILEKVGLSDFSGNYPKTLSGGMEQRVLLARALVMRPRILLLDEPFAALDALTRARLNLELLRLWKEYGLTAIMVTHDISEAVFFSDRVLILSPRPATIAQECVIDLPRPRHPDMEYSEAFLKYLHSVRSAMII